MPTGYTSIIIEKNATFEEFVWTCARAFGAMIHMRDDEPDASIRKDVPGHYHAEALAKTWARLAALEQMTPEQAEREAAKEYEETCQRALDRAAAVDRERALYETMLANVKAWQPPTEEHRGLKDFMVQQIEESIRWDCTYHAAMQCKRLSGREWLAASIATAKRDLEHHAKEDREARERSERRNRWIDDLERSVPMPGRL